MATTYFDKPLDQDVSGKADKVSSATNGHFAGLDSNGNLTDSGKTSSDFVPATSFYGTSMPMSSTDSTSVNEAIANKGTPVYIGSKAGSQEFTLDWNTYDEYYCIAQYGNSDSKQAQCIEYYVRNVLSNIGRAYINLCSGQGGIEVQLTLTNQNKLSLSYFGISGAVYTTTSYLYVWGIKK